MSSFGFDRDFCLTLIKDNIKLVNILEFRIVNLLYLMKYT